MKKIILSLVCMLGFIPDGFALDCGNVPECESMGYSLENDPSCAENGYILCPFDEHYKKCVNFSCASMGYTKSSKKSWCANIVVCPMDKNYSLCATDICQIGDILYGDGGCGRVADYNGTKLPVGVVYFVRDGGRSGKAISLKNLTIKTSDWSFNPENPFGEGNSKLPWGLWHTDVAGVTNYSEEALVTAFNNNTEDLYNGKNNTAKVATAKSAWGACASTNKPGNYAVGTSEYAAYCDSIAAQATIAFYPDASLRGDSKVGAGKWYLPSIGELAQLYGVDGSAVTEAKGISGAGDNDATKRLVNSTLSFLATKGVAAAPLDTDDRYWSSSEYFDSSSSLDASWNIVMKRGNRQHLSRQEGHYVRASIEF